MPPKTSTATIVLGLLLSLSVAVLGSAFAPATSLVLPSRHQQHQHQLSPATSAKLYTKRNDEDDDDKDIKQQQQQQQQQQAADDVEALIAQDALRGGGTATLPAALPAMPTLRDFRKFAIPCLALWVSGPLLSLVDTSFVGLSGSAADSAKQLAALGPATTFFDGATYLFAFLNVATTNLYSSARARKGEQSDEAEGVVRTAARVSRNCGIGLMFFLFFACRPLLKLYIGTFHIQ